MPNAAKILSRKGGETISIAPDATVLEAAQLMNQHHIGSLVVLAGEKLAGIVTERDVLVRVVAAKRDPTSLNVSDIMTTPVACATPETTGDELRNVMREKRIRHVPVVDGARVVGMISIGDLNRSQHDVQEATIRYLEQYMSVS